MTGASQRDNMITADEVTKIYRLGRGGTVTALDRLSIAVARGEVRALLGPNGAGKSTAVQVFTTLTVPTSGRATIAGLDVVAQPGAVRELIGASGQSAAVDDRLTGLENLRLIASLSRRTTKKPLERAMELIERFDLVDAKDRSVKEYSGGMRRRVDIAGAMLAEPQVLFLDEPTTGLDPRSRQGVWELIAELAARGTTVVLTTQYLEEADRLADSISVIDSGRVIAEGTADELKNSVGLQRAELTLEDATDREAAVSVARRVVGDEASICGGDVRELSVPIGQGTRTLSGLLLEFESAGIELTDAGIRRPTLDDVFFQLTGTTNPDRDQSEDSQ